MLEFHAWTLSLQKNAGNAIRRNAGILIIIANTFAKKLVAYANNSINSIRNTVLL